MEARPPSPQGVNARIPLSALAILPNRALAQPFLRALPESRSFQIAAEWTSYPTAARLETQLRQMRPEVLLMDVSANLTQAIELIEAAAAFFPPVPVIALHMGSDGEALLHCLRAGAAEFRHAPFTPDQLREAVSRISSLLSHHDAAEPRRGRLVVFSSTKPGSGASTLAAYTAFALHEVTGQRILLADFAPWSGTVRLLFKLPDTPSLADVLEAVDAERLSPRPESWAALVLREGGVDLLPSPAAPAAGNPDPSRLRKVLECARAVYDWVIVDLPTIFDRLSLLMLPEAEHGFLVSTPELPSLHLTRKAVSMLGQMGLTLDNFHVLVNRVGKADGLTLEAMAKIFKAPVYASFPNDYLSLHKALSTGQPVGPCAIERALWQFAHAICSQPGACDVRPAGAGMQKAS